MCTDRGDQQSSAGERVVVLPDLDEEVTAALADVEELLMTLRWQETGDPDDLVTHPAALGGGVALQALRRIADTVRPQPNQPGHGDRWAAAGPGRTV